MDEDLREIAELALQRYPYGCFVGDWNPVKAEQWRKESEELSDKFHAAVRAAAKKRGIEHKHF